MSAQAPTYSDLEVLELWRQAGGTAIPGNRGEAGYLVLTKLVPFLRRLLEASGSLSPLALALTPAELEEFRAWKAQGRQAAAAAAEVDDVPASPDESSIKPGTKPPPAPPAAPVTAAVAPYARGLFMLMRAACPGLEEGENIITDAERVAATFGQAELAGYFVLEDLTVEDGPAVSTTKVHTEVGAEHAHEADVFPLYRRAAIVAKPAPAVKPGDLEPGEHDPDLRKAPAPAPRAKAAGGRKAAKP